MAQDGTLFRWLGGVHPRFGTPHRAMVVQAIWAVVLAATNSYGALFSRVIYTEWIFFAALAAGLFLLRRRPDYAPAYRLRGYPLLPIVFIAVALVVVVTQVLAVPIDSAIGLGMVLIGLPVYFLWSRRRSSTFTITTIRPNTSTRSARPAARCASRTTRRAIRSSTTLAITT